MTSKLYLSLLFGLLATVQLSHADVETFKPSFPKFYNSSAERKANNQLYYLGEAKFQDHVRVPFYGVTAENPADGDGEKLIRDFRKCTTQTCDFKFKLDASQAKQLKLLALPSIGLTLAPRHWQEIQSNAGANGTGYALIMSPDHQQAIELSDSAFCVGCGMGPATLFFPKLLKQSVEYEYGGYQDRNKLLTVVYPTKNVAFFSYQIPGLPYKTHGVAKYQDDGDFNFRNIQVILNPEQTNQQQALVRTILNFYHYTH